MSPTIKALIWANVAMFVVAWLIPGVTRYLGLRPEDVVTRFYVWQPVTYLFLHAGFFHILFNMLALWMFGVELERLWGTKFFLKYYFLTGVGAAVTTMLLAFVPLPGEINATLRYSLTVGASGAIYGLLLAYALYFPDRPLYMFPIPIPIAAKYFVMILGGIALLSSMSAHAGRRREHRAPGRAGVWVPVSEGVARAAAGGDQVPLLQVEDEPGAPAIRRLLRREEGLGPESCTERRRAYALGSGLWTSFALTQSLRGGLNRSSSSVSSSASAWCGSRDGMCSTSPSRTVNSSPPTCTRSAPCST